MSRIVMTQLQKRKQKADKDDTPNKSQPKPGIATK